MRCAVAVVLSGAIACATAPAESPRPTDASPEAVAAASSLAARINDQPLEADRYSNALHVLGRSANNPAIRAQTLDALIKTQVLLQKAEEKKVVATEQEQQAAWQAELLKRLDPLGRKILKRFGPAGLSHERNAFLAGYHVDRLWDAHCEGEAVNEEEARADFESRKSAFENPERAWLLQVFVSDKSRADDLLKRAQTGESLDALAQVALGSDRGEAQQIMVSAAGRVAPYQLKAVQALKVDDVGVYEHRGQTFLVKKVFHQTAKDADFDQERPAIERALRRLKCTNKTKQLQKEWLEAAKVDILTDDAPVAELLKRRYASPAKDEKSETPPGDGAK